MWISCLQDLYDDWTDLIMRPVEFILRYEHCLARLFIVSINFMLRAEYWRPAAADSLSLSLLTSADWEHVTHYEK